MEALTRLFADLAAFRRGLVATLEAAGWPAADAAELAAAAARRPVEEECAAAAAAGIRILTREDGDYPLLLREVKGAPPVLYVRGSLDAGRDAPAVAVVGTRRPTPYGRNVARQLGRQLGRAGITVVSGLARGVDAAAHEGALEGGGRTVAVLGCGLDRCYPPEHDRLLEAVARAGAVLSEFPLGSLPLAGNFPRRNRIISGLVRGVVVVEAAERSGSLITARLALEQGREVFAVPGPITSAVSRGAHALLRQGARLVGGAEDIFEELGLGVAPPAEPELALSAEEQRVLECLGPEPTSLDRLVALTGLPAERLAVALSGLELKDRVMDVGGSRVVRL
ncbi:MAG: DNA-processing protein DprA [Planctomycetes bacterium]|nr:DNA-processing protein DprA [Planctomycetota bacterium]